jgi:small subunit ribosomal protein S3
MRCVLGAQGIKIMCAGRLNGNRDRANRVVSRRPSASFIRCAPTSITASPEARTTYGVIGIKVWVFKGEVLAHNAEPAAAPVPEAPKRPRRSAAPGVKNAAAS